jgi:glycosyltransferase involved in cell wall biosynthesis
MKVALVYDRVNKWGGAERVLLALHKLFPDAPLYTAVYNKKKAAWAHVFTVHSSFLQSFPFAKSSHEYFAPFMPVAFESMLFGRFDLVISVTSEAAKGILTKPKTTHLCYCLTPTRYLWSGYNDYFPTQFSKIVSKPAVSYLQAWDTVAAQRPDGYIAISREVASRIKTYYGRESDVVYPPVTLGIQNTSLSEKKLTAGYFLVVSRLVSYKKIDIAIKACNELKLPLKIVGSGSEMPYLRSIAGKTIEFVGNLTDAQLVEYYKKSLALLFPGLEDFGLTIIEAQRFGKPVIAFKKGAAIETIIEGKTGCFFSEQSAKSLQSAIQSFLQQSYNPLDCIKNAERFSQEKFEEDFMKVIKKYI